MCTLQAESANERLRKIDDASRAAKKQDVSPSERENKAGNAAFKQKQYQKVGHILFQSSAFMTEAEGLRDICLLRL